MISKTSTSYSSLNAVLPANVSESSSIVQPCLMRAAVTLSQATGSVNELEGDFIKVISNRYSTLGCEIDCEALADEFYFNSASGSLSITFVVHGQASVNIPQSFSEMEVVVSVDGYALQPDEESVEPYDVIINSDTGYIEFKVDFNYSFSPNDQAVTQLLGAKMIDVGIRETQ